LLVGWRKLENESIVLRGIVTSAKDVERDIEELKKVKKAMQVGMKDSDTCAGSGKDMRLVGKVEEWSWTMQIGRR
jgi:hypothetical protein